MVLEVSIFICLLWVEHEKIFAYWMILIFMHVFMNFLRKVVDNSLVMLFLFKYLQLHAFLY